MDKLKVVAVASSEETRTTLYKQLQALEFIEFDGVALELSDVVSFCQQRTIDVLIIDLTGREVDGGLFIEAMSMDASNEFVIFALHRELDHHIILEAIRRGAKEFIHYPDDLPTLETSLNKYLMFRRNQAQQKEKTTGKIISVFASKGGAGCSTVAVNLAHELRQQTQEPVMLFDMDQVFSNTAVMLNLKPNHSLAELSDNRPQDVDDQLLKTIITPHESGMDLLVSCKSVLDDYPMIPPSLIERVMDYFSENYRYIIIDLPTHVLDPYHQYLLERSEEVLLVSCLDIPGLHRTRQYVDLLKQHMAVDKVKLILNRCNLKSAYGMSNKNLEDEFHYPVYCHLPNDWDLTVEANSLGTVLSKLNPNAELSKSFKKLAHLLSDTQTGLQEANSSGPSGFLGKLSSSITLLKKGKADHVSSQAKLGI